MKHTKTIMKHVCIFSRKKVAYDVSFSGYWKFSDFQQRLQFTINVLPLSYSHRRDSWSEKLGWVLHF